MAEEEKSINLIVKYLAGFGGTIGALTAVLFGVGFLVTRAHYGMLGVWSEIPIIKEAYLYEGGRFFVYSIYHLIFVVPYALVVTGILYVFKTMVSLTFHGIGKFTENVTGRKWLKRRHPFLKKSALTPWQFIVSISAIIIFPLLYSQPLFIERLLFYVKEMVPPNVIARLLQQSRLEGKPLVIYYGWLVAGTLAMGFLIWYDQWENNDFTSKALRFALGMIFIFQILLLPINYGVLVKNTLYPVAYISIQKMSREKVWLLSESFQDLIIYRNNPQEKEMKGIFIVKKQDINELHIIGYENILKK